MNASKADGNGLILATDPRDPRMYDVDDDFRRVLIDMSALTVASATRRDRFFHATSTAARGVLTVLDAPLLPAHGLLRPGRRFPVVVRYSNSVGTDDVKPTVRGLTLRLLDAEPDAATGLEPGLLDLTFNTGPTFFASTAEIFRRSFGTPEERERNISEKPEVRSIIWNNIRTAGSYVTYDFYSQVPQGFVAEDGRQWLIRFRVYPVDEPLVRGDFDHGDLWWPPDAPEEIPRPGGDTRAPGFLRDDLRHRIRTTGVRNVLQAQLHPLDGTPEGTETALDPARAWPEGLSPWFDLGDLHLDTLADDDAVNRLAFDPGLAPAELGIALARSPHSTASLNHLRALIYQAASYARLGERQPPELTRLLRPSRNITTAAVVTPSTAGSPGTHGRPRTVVVIGAGPSGLTIARELERVGHRVTVLEARDAVAGKCETVDIGGRAYDLGGHICTNEYERVAELATELGVATEATTPYRILDVERSASTPQDTSFFRRDTFLRYRALREREFPRIGEPGLAHSAKALAAPVSQWLAEHGLQSMAASFGTGYTAAGYGYLDDDVPALYFVKYAEMTGLLSHKPPLLGHPGAFTIAGGFATLWRRVAEELSDLRCAVRVESVERHTDGVRVHTDSGLIEADDLVLTVALDQVLPILDSTAEERELAARIRGNDYHTTVATASGLPGSAFYFLKQHNDTREATGHCVAYHHRYPDSDVQTFYSYGRAEDITPLLRDDIARLGGELEEVHLQRQWAFMPHFGSDDLQSGVLDRLEVMQGRHHTYYAGSLPSFELVECTVAYAQDLARRHFPSSGGARTHSAPAAVPGQAAVTAPALGARLTVNAVRDWLVTNIAAELRLPAAAVDTARPLEEYALESLSVAALQSRLSDWLGYRIPHTLFMELPTIDEAARFLAEPDATAPAEARSGGADVARPAPRHLIPLNSARPFFCAGGLGGSALYLTSLARALGDGRPCYAFEVPGLDGKDEPLDDVEDLGALFAEEIQRIQPHGPYLLGGHSFGGVIAYEAARQLREHGEKVHKVVLFDSYVPLPGRGAPADDDLRAVEELLALRHISCLAADTCTCGVDRSKPLDEQGEQIARALGAPDDPESYESHLVNVVGTYQAGLRAFALYQPEPSDLSVVLVKPEAGFAPLAREDHRVPMHFDPPNGWDTVELGDLTVITVPGNHFSMFTRPYLAAVAEAARTSLAGAR
ncbi:alpha/beta fold hydrolase [Streptomyces sp. NPDC002896]|uniref:alpha/beta fold hydrolase n=1 Tax=Streptomyces sp. NPDC002896 TaxID=3154438 RepID=UPI0033326F0E